MNIRFLKTGLVLVSGLAVIALSTHAIATIKDTRHNLSSWSPYAIKADPNADDPRKTQICIFCHAPHNADSTQAPLWNHQDTGDGFSIASTMYVRPSNTSNIPMDTQPSRTSKKCLSCHDGTVAIGALANGSEIKVIGASGTVGSNPNNALSGTRDANGEYVSGDKGWIGKNLSKGHVISFKYDNNVVTYLNGTPKYSPNPNSFVNGTDPSMLDKMGYMQCHTCHDPHNDWCNDTGKRVGNDPLWRKACDAEGNGSVCAKCHSATYDFYTSPKYPF
jgi:hypothetical protein